MKLLIHKNSTMKKLLFLACCMYLFAAHADSLTYSIKIKTIDLSEDLAPGATFNDELVLLLYKKSVNIENPLPLVREYFVADSSHKTKIYSFKTDSLLSTDTLRLVLIEQDTRKQLKAFDAICRVYFKELLKNKKGYYEFIDDDDMLGIAEIPAKTLLDKKTFIKKFETLNLFDWAVYKIEINQKE